MLYKPFRGDGIVINEDGLRTKSPTLKQLGEWRLAVTGGSAVWGPYVLEVDAIPLQLQQLLDRRDHHDISVYNFGIEAIDIAGEPAVLPIQGAHPARLAERSLLMLSRPRRWRSKTSLCK